MNAREIDWSKAPAGATHFGPESEEWIAAWYKLDEGEWFATLTSDDDQWDYSPFVDDERVSQMIQRPAEWSGIGMPPVGTVCEANMPPCGLRDGYAWRRVKVVHCGLPDSACEILVYDIESTQPAWVDEFRPIRAPEQIAAEERVEAARQMCKDAGRPECTRGQMEQALMLYDAGYRKVEGDKQ